MPRAAAPASPFNLSVDYGPVGLQLARRRLEGAGCAHLLVEAVLPGGLAHRDGLRVALDLAAVVARRIVASGAHANGNMQPRCPQKRTSV